MQRLRTVACWLALLALSCSSESEAPAAAASCSSDQECAKVPGKTACDAAKKTCVAPPRGSAIGRGDGSASSVELVEIRSTGAGSKPTDLEFHPERQDELWVVLYAPSSVNIGFGIGGDSPSWKSLRDVAAKHFMYHPPALAMGQDDTWGTCGNNDNSQNSDAADGYAVDFMGPALFSSNLSIFAQPSGKPLGSHLDMLHNTSFCKGIAHEKENWFWVFNGKSKSIDHYNFNHDHGPGNDDHSDGEIYRYVQGEVKPASDETPSHLTFDRETGFVYIADTGNQRIVRLDPRPATKSGPLPLENEPLMGSGIMSGAKLDEVVKPGTLTAPSGIELRDKLLYVTDAATSRFHVFALEGTLVRSLDTGLPAGSLAGFTFGPEGKIYFVDRVGNRVMRIDAK